MSAEDMHYTQLPQTDGHTQTINVMNGNYSLISLRRSTQNRYIHASPHTMNHHCTRGRLQIGHFLTQAMQLMQSD